MSKTAEVTMDKIESDILKATEEFAKVHSLHYDKHTASMVLNGMRAYHSSKLSEVKGLPTAADLIRDFKATGSKEANTINVMWLEGAKWMRSIAQQVISKKDIEILHQTTAKNEWKLLREETLAELNKMRELNESLSETILQQNREIVELKNRLAEKKINGGSSR